MSRDRGYYFTETDRGGKWDGAPGFPDRRPIIEDRGTRDHRGRGPIGGCGCVACLAAVAIRVGASR